MYTKANAAVLAALAVPALVDDTLISASPLNERELLELARLDVRSATTDVNVAGETIRSWVTTFDGYRAIEVKEHGTSLEVDVTILGEAEEPLEAFLTEYDWATRLGSLMFGGECKLTPKQTYLALAEAALRGYVAEDGEILDLKEQKKGVSDFLLQLSKITLEDFYALLMSTPNSIQSTAREAIDTRRRELIENASVFELLALVVEYPHILSDEDVMEMVNDRRYYLESQPD